MVDYTKPTMRDETWRRWKGGQKLADELRAFYTHKRVFDRLGAQVPLAGASSPATQAARKGLWARVAAMQAKSPGGKFAARLASSPRGRMMVEFLSGRDTTPGEDKEAAAAAQSGVTLRR